MKNWIYSLLSLIALIATNFLISKLFNTSFIEMSFLTGLLISMIIFYFSSEGGFFTSKTDLPIKHLLESESRRNTHFLRFYINIPFIVSALYTIIAAILSIIVYWEYF
ncbi:hypothetical protein [Romboutsia hominis]|uniref:DUF3899 domain-containing protein n=1 Tax=Romboutsia hominis TaxID=1507512 RepID=A0A2P2BV14_9FIRM|nr:hypothetical protein [Romboutsia hominis]CEI74190.1 Hypothetical protein FRIFI_2670 [Romboutsia hominis]